MNSSTFNFLSHALQSRSDMNLHTFNGPAGRVITAWSRFSRTNVLLVVVSGGRLVRADHVASAQRGHLVHAGAVLAASPREAHLSVL